ncbi:hypothetical protein JCM11491_003609 [Sporobolomyces phaffii]
MNLSLILNPVDHDSVDIETIKASCKRALSSALVAAGLALGSSTDDLVYSWKQDMDRSLASIVDSAFEGFGGEHSVTRHQARVDDWDRDTYPRLRNCCFQAAGSPSFESIAHGVIDANRWPKPSWFQEHVTRITLAQADELVIDTPYPGMDRRFNTDLEAEKVHMAAKIMATIRMNVETMRDTCPVDDDLWHLWIPEFGAMEEHVSRATDLPPRAFTSVREPGNVQWLDPLIPATDEVYVQVTVRVPAPPPPPPPASTQFEWTIPETPASRRGGGRGGRGRGGSSSTRRDASLAQHAVRGRSSHRQRFIYEL